MGTNEDYYQQQPPREYYQQQPPKEYYQQTQSTQYYQPRQANYQHYQQQQPYYQQQPQVVYVQQQPQNTGHLIRRQLFQQRRFKYTGIVSKCPEPVYDTGCTFCQPPLEIEQSLHDTAKPIRHTAPPLSKIIVYLSNISDNNAWPKKVEAYDIMKNISDVGRGNGNMIVLSSLPPKDPTKIEQEATYMVFPDSKYVNVNLQAQPQEDSFKALFQKLNNNESLDTLFKESPSVFDISPITKTTVLICGHTQRDQRCGVIGKLIHDEFAKVLQHENLQDDVQLGYVSHVGGHVYAGNVLIMKPDGTFTWYGLVKPKNVQGIVEKSIKDNQIIEELTRG